MSPLPTLETTRLRLRPYSQADIAELLPLIGTREVAATTLRIAHPYPESRTREASLPSPGNLTRSGSRSPFEVTAGRSVALACVWTISISTLNSIIG